MGTTCSSFAQNDAARTTPNGSMSRYARQNSANGFLRRSWERERSTLKVGTRERGMILGALSLDLLALMFSDGDHFPRVDAARLSRKATVLL